MPLRREKSQLKANLDLWLNNLFLLDGFYNTIRRSQTDVYGRDLSLLSLQSSADYSDNRVFQSAFKSWVHESGLRPSYSLIPPILVSGVYVNGTFMAKDPSSPSYNASFAHSVDYPNGRIIFNSPVSVGSSIQAEFSYKEVSVDFADAFANEAEEFYFETSYKDNPYQTGVVIYPQENSRTLPLVMIDVLSRNNLGYELGNASNLTEIRGSFHVWARDAATRDMIEDLIEHQEHTVINGINFNNAPMPLGYNGDKNPSFTTYANYAGSTTGSYTYRKLYIDTLSSFTTQPFYNIERARIDFLVRIYPTF